MSSGKRIWTLLAVAAVSLAGASARAIAQKENPPEGFGSLPGGVSPPSTTRPMSKHRRP